MKRQDLELVFVTDSQDPAGLLELVRKAIAGGVTMVQLRKKNTAPEEIADLGKTLLCLTRPAKVPLIINDFPHVAKAIGAQGVHLGQMDMPPRQARSILGPRATIGLSIENETQLRSADISQVDYFAASPVFETASKTDTAPALGLDGLHRLKLQARVPLVAIGGIGPTNVRRVLETGADGIAVVSSIASARDPREAAAALRNQISDYRRQNPPFPKRRVLTIAGSDSGGGAGVQADLKTFQALGCYGSSALTALTAQNTLGVEAVFGVPGSFVKAQIDAVLNDIGADGIKVGMLYCSETIESLADILSNTDAPVVVDPVMLSKSGCRLLEENAVELLKRRLFRLASVVTPNVPEAEALIGTQIKTREDFRAMAEQLLEWSEFVVLKGGHFVQGTVVEDLVMDRGGLCEWIRYPRIESANSHGTGCTFSSAIAAFLARGLDRLAAVKAAREYLQNAIRVGSRTFWKGCGPVEHAWEGK